jgi:hypothetical protein
MQNEELRALYPKLSEAELEEARENLRAYLTLAWEIWEAHPERFDAVHPEPYDQGKVDSPQTN